MNAMETPADMASKAARIARGMAFETIAIANAVLAMAGDGNADVARAAIDAAQAEVDAKFPYDGSSDYETVVASIEAAADYNDDILGSEVLRFARTARICAEAAAERAAEAGKSATFAREAIAYGNTAGAEGHARAAIGDMEATQIAFESALTFHHAVRKIKHPPLWRRVLRIFQP